ncbi:MAG: hypothetical protein NTU85_01175 [Candidatus Kaiserbacteria bacterium]|nr:hypothetical protein [Candidatus Kaiserbacteria bacterium]
MRQLIIYRGNILLLTLVFLGVFFTIAVSYFNFVTRYTRSENVAVASSQAFELAEAGVDMAIYQLNQNTNYTGETIALGNGTFTTTIASIDSSSKRITATAYVPSSANPIATKTVKATVSTNNNIVSFRYGVQAGTGGFIMNGGAAINGSVYANGDIDATTGVHIYGSATAANASIITTDQKNDTPAISSCTSSTCITFANSSATQDVAQSFKISTTTSVSDIQFYLKKVGSPNDATIRIVNDSNGSPGTTVLLSSTLSASLVTTNFGWVDVAMPSTPVLNMNQTYWMVIDAGNNSSKYYIIGANANGYANGVAKVGQQGGSWSATTPAGLDEYFRIFLGNGGSMIGGDTWVGGVNVGTTASDDAWAHTIKGASVTGTIYCQSGDDNNKSCNMSRPDPTPATMPLSDGNIQEWKDEATAGGVINGDYHVDWDGDTLGPKKITGNLLVDGGGTLTISGTLWVVGNITVTGGGKVKLASSYGANDGAIVSDGRVTVDGGGKFEGSGQTGSYPFLITTSTCPSGSGCNGANAILLSGGGGAVALIAQNGTVYINGNGEIKAVTAKQVKMDGGGHLIYDSGLINANFSSGPGGSWTFVPGSYAITQ